jgi:hypothetical protein
MRLQYFLVSVIFAGSATAETNLYFKQRDTAQLLSLLKEWKLYDAFGKDFESGAVDGSMLALLTENDVTAEINSLTAESKPRAVHWRKLYAHIQSQLKEDLNVVHTNGRKLSGEEYSGIHIKTDNAAIVLGPDGDVSLQRIDDDEMSITGSITVDGDGRFDNGVFDTSVSVGGDASVDGTLQVTGDASFGASATVGEDMTVQGHLEVDGTISTGYGRITRDFHQYFTTTSTSAYYEMKTSIEAQGAIMYRLEILGYAYGAGSNIDSVTTGYTYSGWDCVSNEDHTDFGYGEIDVYCSDDGYLVLSYYCPSTYYLGLTVSGWFLNPTGYAHDIEVLDAAFTTSQGYFDSSRRNLEEDTNIISEHIEDEEAKPVEETRGRTSLHGIQDEVIRQGKELKIISELQQELVELRARVALLEGSV